MHNYRKRWAAVFFNFTIILSIMAFRLSPATAQGTRADYERAAQLQRLTDGKVFRTHVRPQWFDDGNHLWYRVPTGADSCEFVLVDAENGIRQPAFDHFPTRTIRRRTAERPSGTAAVLAECKG